MTELSGITQKCTFETDRLSIKNRKNEIEPPRTEKIFAQKVIDILSPEVTKSLPPTWQSINSIEEAIKWIRAGLHLEVELPEKQCGISVELSW